MRMILTITLAALVVASFAALHAEESGTQADKLGAKVSFSFDAISALDAAGAIVKQTSINLVVAEKLAARTISMKLTDVSARTALEVLATLAGGMLRIEKYVAMIVPVESAQSSRSLAPKSSSDKLLEVDRQLGQYITRLSAARKPLPSAFTSNPRSRTGYQLQGTAFKIMAAMQKMRATFRDAAPPSATIDSGPIASLIRRAEFVLSDIREWHNANLEKPAARPSATVPQASVTTRLEALRGEVERLTKLVQQLTDRLNAAGAK